MTTVAVALVAMGVLLYTYVGYPILVILLSKLFPLRVRRDESWTPHVTACVPVVDGKAYVQQKLDSLLALDWPADKLDVLIYSDGSKDGSDDIVKAAAAKDARVRLLRGETRSGKPTALNAMLGEARGEVLLMTDIRQPLEKDALRNLVARLADPAVGCVSGNLVLRGSTGASAYWKYEKVIREAEGAFRGLVGVSGSIYVVRRADVTPLPPDTVLDDMWVPMVLRLARRRILFARDAVAYDEAAEDDREFGRKVRTLAGNFQLFARLPRLLFPLLNPSWLETFSHKILRLVCPLALLALAVSTSAGLTARVCEGTVWEIVLGILAGGQIAFYLGAALGSGVGKPGSLARTFVVLNAAALVGGWRWLTGGQRITW
jgi:cellulose synthase/poly-beta-1,6-N-acetylglucosamine synthase-like glycosyltransferase